MANRGKGFKVLKKHVLEFINNDIGGEDAMKIGRFERDERE